MKCDKCGTEVKEGDKFCPSCGSALVKKKFCGKCGGGLLNTDKFCSKCGASNPNFTGQPKMTVTTQKREPGNLDPGLQESKVNSRSETAAGDSTPSFESASHDIQGVPENTQHDSSALLEHQSADQTVSLTEQTPRRHPAVLIWIGICIAIIACLGYLYLTGRLFNDRDVRASQSLDEPEPTALTDQLADNKDSAMNSVKVLSEGKDNDTTENISFEKTKKKIYAMGFKEGRNDFDADMIHTDGRRFPFKLYFDFSPDSSPEISNAVYDNSAGKTTIKLNVVEFSDDFVRFEGSSGGKDFVLQFSGRDPYSGDAWWGDFHQDVELHHHKF